VKCPLFVSDIKQNREVLADFNKICRCSIGKDRPTDRKLTVACFKCFLKMSKVALFCPPQYLCFLSITKGTSFPFYYCF
jgi:hypothetical protein